MSWATVLHCDNCSDTLDDDCEDRSEIQWIAEIKGWVIRDDDHALCTNCAEG